MALDPGEHDPAEVGLEQPMGLGNGVIEFGAFFEFIAVHVRLVEEFGGSLGAFAADGVQFKNESGRPANREFNVRSCCILHAQYSRFKWDTLFSERLIPLSEFVLHYITR